MYICIYIILMKEKKKILNIRLDFQEVVKMLQEDKQYQGAVFIKDDSNLYAMRIVDNKVVIYENENKIDLFPFDIFLSTDWYIVK